MSATRYDYETDEVSFCNPIPALVSKRSGSGWRLVHVHPAALLWERPSVVCPICHGDGVWPPDGYRSGPEPCRLCKGSGLAVAAQPQPVETPAPAEPVPCPVDVALSKLRAEREAVSKSLASSGDRRDWDGSSSDGYKLEAIESVIEVLERAKAGASR